MIGTPRLRRNRRRARQLGEIDRRRRLTEGRQRHGEAREVTVEEWEPPPPPLPRTRIVSISPSPTLVIGSNTTFESVLEGA